MSKLLNNIKWYLSPTARKVIYSGNMPVFICFNSVSARKACHFFQYIEFKKVYYTSMSDIC